MPGLNADTAKAAPIGAISALTLAIVAACCVAFRLLLQTPVVSPARWLGAGLIVAAYLLFAPAVAGSLYSLLFEGRKHFGLAGLGVAGLSLLMFLILADGLLMLPFWFLAIMGVAKFVRWRASKL